jgi:pyruvate/2-oxoglutarate/acetoin dehydrogenase E1 component/TPP-dependent pyruvate/acetoin dehydrogenase alpha subunit
MDTNQIVEESILENLSFEKFKEEVLKDYRVVCESRETSLLSRKEVLTGKAKFGIFGAGKEVAQVAMAKYFMPGDFRAGYYRDQTFMFASGMATIEQFFAQLYADPDLNNDPFSAGRQMNSHFATRFVDEEGNWEDLANKKNISSDIAPTSGQMPRALGLAFASKVFRKVDVLRDFTNLSQNGNEVCFCTIGDAATSEGHFWETMNAAGVLQIPLAVFVWDDGYGISVPKKYQTTKGSISKAMSGLQKKEDSNGINIYKLKGWDYAGMCEILDEAIRNIRETHVPALFHVDELTQPQGHSTSGSHERYKSPERLEWEKKWDAKKQMRDWIIANSLADDDELNEIENNAKHVVKAARLSAWNKYISPIKEEVAATLQLLESYSARTENKQEVQKAIKELSSLREPLRRDVMTALANVINFASPAEPLTEVKDFYEKLKKKNAEIFNTYLYNEGPKSALKVEKVPAIIPQDAELVNGFEVLNRYFDALFAADNRVIAFGEDIGRIGDVNQGFSGLQAKYGEERIFDTGIRELTIIGQGMGLALRGLRPITEIQYLDYLLFALEPLSDDVCTTHYRTKGQQSVPLIVRTRGHRLEGIWHSGSPMGMIINSLRGMYVCVPRNMTQAVGMYNTLLMGNDPAIIIECLNGYRLKEKLPVNLLEYRVPLGIPEVIKEGTDITIVSYGSVLRIILEATKKLEKMGISCEVIDVQTLLPFDRHHKILDSLKKTNRILFVDEDVPGGASAFMFNHVMEIQGGYRWLDVSPRTLTAKAHRPAYGSDGDYFSKPNEEDVIGMAKEMMAE